MNNIALYIAYILNSAVNTEIDDESIFANDSTANMITTFDPYIYVSI